MPYVHFIPDDIRVETDGSETLLELSLKYGLPHTNVCGGNARCSTCRVLVLHGIQYCSPRTEKEASLAENLEFGQAIRLACQTRAIGDVTLRRLVLDEEDTAFTDQTRTDAAHGPVGEEKRIAILFADIRDFTGFAEVLPPYDVIHVLNRFFHFMGDVITKHDGYIDNYTGDGLMALFGVAHPKGAALNAVAAALDMIRAVEAAVSPYVEALFQRPLEIGIGIHYGEAVVGAVGTPGSRKTTAVGGCVNFARRVESANKVAGTKLLISEETHKQLGRRVKAGKSVRLSLQGVSGEHTLYEVIGLSSRTAQNSAARP